MLDVVAFPAQGPGVASHAALSHAVGEEYDAVFLGGIEGAFAQPLAGIPALVEYHILPVGLEGLTAPQDDAPGIVILEYVGAAVALYVHYREGGIADLPLAADGESVHYDLGNAVGLLVLTGEVERHG